MLFDLRHLPSPGGASSETTLAMAAAPQLQQLPNYKDWLRGTDLQLWCAKVTLASSLRLPWKYTAAMAAEGHVWECTAVWVHSAFLPNDACQASASASASASVSAVREAVDVISSDVDRARYTLLVDPEGLFFDRRRLGGDHQVNLPTRPRITFSVRRGEADSDHVLLAIVWESKE